MARRALFGLVVAAAFVPTLRAQNIDPSDGPFTSAPLTISGEAGGNVGDIDLQAGHTYVFETVDVSQGCDPAIELRVSSGPQAQDSDRVVAENDDAGGGGWASRIEYSCTDTGAYYIHVRAVLGRGGSLAVRITDQGGGGGESEVFSVQAQMTGDRPYYSNDFALETGHTYAVATSDLSDGCDTVIQLRRSTDVNQAHDDDPVVGENDDAGGGLASALQWECDRTSQYYVSVRCYNAERAGSFRLTVTHTCCGGGGPLLSADAQITEERPYNSADFECVAGRTYVVETGNLSQGCDTVIQLRRSTDPQQAHEEDPVIAENDDHEGALSSHIEWTCDQTGQYYVHVRCFAGRPGSFRLTVAGQ